MTYLTREKTYHKCVKLGLHVLSLGLHIHGKKQLGNDQWGLKSEGLI